MLYIPVASDVGGQVGRWPTGITSGPSQAEAKSTARTNATSIHMWLTHKRLYGECGVLNIIGECKKQASRRAFIADSGFGAFMGCLYVVLVVMKT